jgi:hypothetical protein
VKLTAVRWLGAAVLAVIVLNQNGLAQNFGADARRIALGGAGSNDNIASRLIEDQQGYTAIPIPIGLYQIFKKREIFDPTDANFDPVRAVEYAADPMHLTLNRDTADGGGHLLINHLVNAELSRDLNTYRGFTPAQQLQAQGLVSPTFGKTLKLVRYGNGGFHGIYVGAGPYLSIGTTLSFDQQLLDIFSSSTDVYLPNTTFSIADTTSGQAAMSITGGYRARVSVPGFEGSKDGVYIAADYNYLHGIHYDSADLDVRFDTDSQGLVTLAPTTSPIVIDRTMSRKGRGFAIDLATAVIKGPWEVGGSVDGIGNHINWNEMTARQYVLLSLVAGGDFVTTQTLPPSPTQRVSLPVRYHGNAGYRTSRWSAVTEVGRGFQGLDFSGGAEYRFGPLAFRGGGRYSRDMWHGATGLGITFFSKLGFDVAAFQNTTNIDNDHRISFAASLRIQHGDDN